MYPFAFRSLKPTPPARRTSRLRLLMVALLLALLPVLPAPAHDLAKGDHNHFLTGFADQDGIGLVGRVGVPYHRTLSKEVDGFVLALAEADLSFQGHDSDLVTLAIRTGATTHWSLAGRVQPFAKQAPMQLFAQVGRQYLAARVRTPNAVGNRAVFNLGMAMPVPFSHQILDRLGALIALPVSAPTMEVALSIINADKDLEAATKRLDANQFSLRGRWSNPIFSSKDWNLKLGRFAGANLDLDWHLTKPLTGNDKGWQTHMDMRLAGDFGLPYTPTLRYRAGTLDGLSFGRQFLVGLDWTFN